MQTSRKQARVRYITKRGGRRKGGTGKLQREKIVLDDL